MNQPIVQDFPKLIVGLGNPGEKYERTRHNIGFSVIDSIAIEFGGVWKSWKSIAVSTEINVNSKQIKLLKPQTYMNRSGEVVSEFAKYFGITPSEIVVIHDELDISSGELRIKFSGGEAGHNGLRSISQMLSTKDYWRIRCGIGKPVPQQIDVSNWVLQPFTKEENGGMKNLTEKCVSIFSTMCKEGIKASQHLLHAEAAKERKANSAEDDL